MGKQRKCRNRQYNGQTTQEISFGSAKKNITWRGCGINGKQAWRRKQDSGKNNDKTYSLLLACNNS
jgi:hypothetical protein